LTLKGIHGTHAIRAPAVRHPREIPFEEGDVCFLAVKSQHTLEAVQALAPVAPRTLQIYCAQNGVRNEEIVERYFPEQTNGVVVYLGATCIQPGVVIHTAGGKLGLGRYPEGTPRGIEGVKAAFDQTPLKAVVTEPIMELKWGKLLVNLNNATYGLIGLSVQEAMHSSEMRNLVADVVEEGLEVLAAAGIPYRELPDDPSPETIIRSLRKESFQAPEIPKEEEMLHWPSLWQDLFLRRGTVEAEYFNGEVVRLGKEVGKATPLNAGLLSLSEATAASKEPPGKYQVQELREILAASTPAT
jgi:2-dehydropantoate 2-reductase